MDIKNLKNDVTYLSPSDCVCPKCGSHNIQNISRITGYLSLDERFNGAKVCERNARVNHNKDHKNSYAK